MDEIIEVYSEAELAAVIDRDGSLFAHIENLRVFASHAFADFDAAVKSGSPELIDFYCGWRGCVLNLTRAAASAALDKGQSFAVIERMKSLIGECRGQAASIAGVLNDLYLASPDEPRLRLRIRGYASDANALAVKMERTVGSVDAFIEKHGLLRAGAWHRAAEAAARVRYLYENIIPSGHVYYPVRPYPPEDIPLGDCVPERPEAWECFRAIPEEELAYDSTHDEFVIPEGKTFSTPHGILDADSIRFDWDHETVTVGFAGGDHTTWPFFKVKHPGDLISGRGYEYYYRKVRS